MSSHTPTWRATSDGGRRTFSFTVMSLEQGFERPAKMKKSTKRSRKNRSRARRDGKGFLLAVISHRYLLMFTSKIGMQVLYCDSKGLLSVIAVCICTCAKARKSSWAYCTAISGWETSGRHLSPPFTFLRDIISLMLNLYKKTVGNKKYCHFYSSTVR